MISKRVTHQERPQERRGRDRVKGTGEVEVEVPSIQLFTALISSHAAPAAEGS